MRAFPRITEIPRSLITSATALLAIGASVAVWMKIDVAPLLCDVMIRRGQLWRLLTSAFPHANPVHLVFNLYWLFVFGSLVEEVYGSLKTAALIVLFAVGSGAAEYALLDGASGLSGVVYGFFGLLWMLGRYDDDERFRGAVDRKTVGIFAVWFVLCIVLTVTNIIPVGNIAQVAGAALGLLAGYAMAQPRSRKIMACGIAALLLLMLCAVTIARHRVNVSKHRGEAEAAMGYKAMSHVRYREASRWYRDAVIYQPGNGQYWFYISLALDRQGDHAGNMAAARKALDLGNADAQYYFGRLYESGREGLPKDMKKAMALYRQAADHGDPELQNRIAWNYAASDDPAIRNPALALEYAHKAVAAGKDHPDPSYLDTLAEAYYVNQQYAEAVSTEQRALSLIHAQPSLYGYLQHDCEHDLAWFQKALDAGKTQSHGK